MRRSNAPLRSIVVLGLAVGLASAVACKGGPGQLPSGDGDDDDVTESSSSGASGISSSSSGAGASSSSGGTKGPTEVTDTFSHSCNTDNDCTLAVLNATTCGICVGQNAAIAKSDEAKYQSAYNQAHANCPQNSAPGSCAAFYSVSQCNTASKTCQFIACGQRTSIDEHHCAPDGG